MERKICSYGKLVKSDRFGLVQETGMVNISSGLRGKVGLLRNVFNTSIGGHKGTDTVGGRVEIDSVGDGGGKDYFWV